MARVPILVSTDTAFGKARSTHLSFEKTSLDYEELTVKVKLLLNLLDRHQSWHLQLEERHSLLDCFARLCGSRMWILFYVIMRGVQA